MADSYDIYTNDIEKMVTDEITDLIDAAFDDKKDALGGKYTQLRKELDDKHLPDDKHIEEEDALDVLYEKELSTLYSIIGTELHPEFTGTTEDELVEYLVAAKIKLYRNNYNEQMRLATQYIRKNLNLDNGDVVQIGGQTYRNENLRFWSSTRGLLYCDARSPYVTDYGTVPSDFKVGNGDGEFSPWHWKDVIDYYDGTIWLSDSFREEVYASLKYEEGSTKYKARLTIHGTTVQITSPVARPRHFQISPVDKTLIEAFE